MPAFTVTVRGTDPNGLQAQRQVSASVEAPPVGWPTTATTGVPAGTTLTPYTGPGEISANGTVIDSKHISGGLFIPASNVTIRKCLIEAAGSGPNDGVMIVKIGTYYNSTNRPTNIVLEDCEIRRPPGSNGGADYAVQVYGANVRLTRCNIHNVTSGVSPADGELPCDGLTVEDSYLWGNVNISGSDHNDGILSNGGARNVILHHNAIEVPLGQTTPIAMYGDLGGPNSYWTVEENLLNGGGFAIYPSYDKRSEQPNHHCIIRNNTFGRKFFPQCGQWGPVNQGPGGASFFDGVGNVWENNRWQDTGALVTP